MHTEETVRAFSGTLRRIFGGVDVPSVDPFTASTKDVANSLVDELVLIDPDENPRTPHLLFIPDLERASSETMATESADNLILAIKKILSVESCTVETRMKPLVGMVGLLKHMPGAGSFGSRDRVCDGSEVYQVPYGLSAYYLLLLFSPLHIQKTTKTSRPPHHRSVRRQWTRPLAPARSLGHG